ncbi:PhzF family phenazine biosynthesis protein [Roseobacter sinensis]|uniref:PhzF family phenazine biosynthesis protein n=1 Tax=Roseobacter sinensis TaxID=2931391 RepID=A0ABT3BAM4_9RHOB|nr:PhzF family phenazine biosynthesis protein [Roseobacter sp. WL0113]MCV3270590.1 PhzF family phenazine biosynthesis protein [Roseobacter sp. WL0113]
MKFDFDWVDAFSDRAFGGNGCAVVHGGAGVPEDVCMAYVRETSLVECTFTGPSDSADLRVRYFLASREIPFAGHPTVATAVAARARGLIEDGPLTLETGAGIIQVEVSGTTVKMTQIAPVFGPTVPADIVAAVGSITASDIVAPPQVVSTGLPFCITVLKDRAALERLRLDVEALAAFGAHLAQPDLNMLEPFWVTLDGATAAGDTYSRLLLAPPSPAEDAFTGSATGAMAAYLWRHGLIDTPEVVAEQGHGMGRPGQAQVRVLGPRDAITGVEVSGQGVIVMSGTVDLPDAV